MSKWDQVKLKELTILLTDGNWIESKDQSAQGIRLIQTGNIGQGVYLNKEEREKYISEETFSALSCTEVFEGDVLISRLPAPVGRSCIVPKLGNRMITAVDCTIVRFNYKKCLPEFFVYYSMSSKYLNQINAHLNGSTRLRISRKKLEEILIPLPPLEVQKQIAQNLDTVSELLALRKKQLEELDELIKSVFYDMFGDPVTNDKGWEVESIVFVCDEIVDCVNKTAPTIEGISEYKMIRTTNIKKGKVDTLNVKYVDEDVYKKWTRRSIPARGDLLLTREAPIGEVGIIESDDKLFLGQRIVSYRINPDKMNSIYLLHLMQSLFFQEQINKLARGSTVKHLSVPECSQFIVLSPPLLLQNQFASIVTKIEEQKTLVKKSIEEIQTLFDSLMSQYFD